MKRLLCITFSLMTFFAHAQDEGPIYNFNFHNDEQPQAQANVLPAAAGPIVAQIVENREVQGKGTLGFEFGGKGSFASNGYDGQSLYGGSYANLIIRTGDSSRAKVGVTYDYMCSNHIGGFSLSYQMLSRVNDVFSFVGGVDLQLGVVGGPRVYGGVGVGPQFNLSKNVAINILANLGYHSISSDDYYNNSKGIVFGGQLGLSFMI